MTWRSAARALVYRNLVPALIAFGRWKPALTHVIRSAAFHLEHAERDKPLAALAMYNNDVLGGYVDAGQDVEAEPRFKTVANLLDTELSGKTRRVVEIGCASGALLAHAARRHPSSNFIGIDFSVTRASERYVLPNLRFAAGYHLENLDAWEGDILVFMSTAACLLPRELDRTFAAAAQKQFKVVILCEPWWWGRRIDAHSRRANSIHMKGICWGHDYPGYLAKHGYTARDLDFLPGEKNEMRHVLIRATAAGSL